MTGQPEPADDALPEHGERAVAALPMERINPPQTFFRGFGGTVRDVWRYRELLVNLVRKELKVKYKGSLLGFLWSLMRPLLLLVIFYVAFGVFLGSPVPDFVVFLFCGLVAWTFFSDVVNGATAAITGNAGLIKKVYFPREILPLSVVGAALVQFSLMLLVLAGMVVAFGRDITPGKLALLPLAFVTLVVFSSAVALVMSAANVYLRDTQHLVDVGLLFWFYMTPILYAIGMIRDRLAEVGGVVEFLYLANPMANVVFGFQHAIYQRGEFDGRSVLYEGDVLSRLLVVLGASLVLLWLSQRVFAKVQGNFAQEL